MFGRSLRAWTATLGVVVIAVAGGGGERTFSASRFSECLQSRDAGPSDLASDDASSEQSSLRDRLAREAREQNGAVRAFTNTDDPNASSISRPFSSEEDEAREAAQRVEEDIELKPATTRAGP